MPKPEGAGTFEDCIQLLSVLCRMYVALLTRSIVFGYINDNFMHAPSRDLSKESIEVIKELMLAQAQECFIEKVTTFDKKKVNHKH